MILCLDAGNSQVYGGVFVGDELQKRFRCRSAEGVSSDEMGLFLRGVLRENDLDYKAVKQIAACSVVPHLDHSLKNACLKYFNISPFFVQAGTRTGLKIRYRNPIEVGADRIANAIAATHLFPNQNMVVVDFGTATTFCVLNKDKEYLGGMILPGMRLSMEALESGTAKLPSVAIVAPKETIGRSTVESIQSGLYYGQVGTVKEVVARITEESFGGIKPLLIGTGGFSSLFDKEKLFDHVLPDLVLKGLYLALKINQ